LKNVLFLIGIMLPHSGHNSSPLKSTQNYVWSTSDVLGQGATGYVYKGRKKVGFEFMLYAESIVFV